MDAPILSPPDAALPFVLNTDASSVGSGAVLAQMTADGERVVAYYSRTFNKAERRYCVTRRELLAVVSAVRHFRYYLGGLHFTVRTDHRFTTTEALRLCDGVLQRGWQEPAAGETRWQVVVPKTLWHVVLQAVHGAPGSGHSGVNKTLRRLRQGFYWGQHRQDVEDYCRRCDSCTARKGPTDRSHAQFQQFPAGGPMERVGIDVLGPFPRTERGNRYILTAMDYFTKWPRSVQPPGPRGRDYSGCTGGGNVQQIWST